MRSNRKGGIITAIVFLIIIIAIGAVIYLIFGEQFRESGERFTEEAAKRARSDYLSMKLALLNNPVGEDECGNGLGLSLRDTGNDCDHADNDVTGGSNIRDCCCCRVITHTFDFGKLYAYKEIEFRFIPHDEFPMDVEIWYSQTADAASFVPLGICDQTFEDLDLEVIDKANREGYVFSCYIRSTDDLADAQFRYVQLRSVTPSRYIDYAKAQVFPALKICEVDPNDRLQPGKGYWVYSHMDAEEIVTIPGWDYMSPIAIIHADPQSALTEEIIDFDGSDSFSPIPGCDIDRYDWNLGDGTILNDAPAVVTHAYDYEGIYQVTLTVTEDTTADPFCNGEQGMSTTWITVVDQYPHAGFEMCYEGFYYTSRPLKADETCPYEP